MLHTVHSRKKNKGYRSSNSLLENSRKPTKSVSFFVAEFKTHCLHALAHLGLPAPIHQAQPFCAEVSKPSQGSCPTRGTGTKHESLSEDASDFPHFYAFLHSPTVCSRSASPQIYSLGGLQNILPSQSTKISSLKEEIS